MQSEYPKAKSIFKLTKHYSLRFLSVNVDGVWIDSHMDREIQSKFLAAAIYILTECKSDF